ncbi:MAG: (2Fe-2S) ferredoxin domain-containing protein [Hydrogenophilus thermoluteolus]
MPYFRHHLFFCCNQRDPGDTCCANHDAEGMMRYARDSAKALGLALNATGGVRINKAGCLGRCDLGPVLVVYPDGIWYTYLDESDIDEILSEHIANGRPVARLMLPQT